MRMPQMLLQAFLRKLLVRGLRVVLVVVLVLWAIAALQPRPEDPFAKVVRAVKPAVALVVVHAKTADLDAPHGAKTPAATTRPAARGAVGDEGIEEVYGTAEVVRSARDASFLLTDAHVVDQARRIEVRFDNGKRFDAAVVRRDDARDAAILRVDAGGLPVVTLGDSRAVAQGDPIGVAGYPIPDGFEDEHLGTGISVYAGRVASLRVSAFELDLPIIPGESGGPVFDARDGAVIGIAESRFDDERAIGFATPIDELRPLLENLR